MKKMLFFITNEQMVNEVNHVNGLDGFNRAAFDFDIAVSKGVVIHIESPVSKQDIIYSLNALADFLEECGDIKGHEYVLPADSGNIRSRYENILTTNGLYWQGMFEIKIW